MSMNAVAYLFYGVKLHWDVEAQGYPDDTFTNGQEYNVSIVTVGEVEINPQFYITHNTSRKYVIDQVGALEISAHLSAHTGDQDGDSDSQDQMLGDILRFCEDNGLPEPFGVTWFLATTIS